MQLEISRDDFHKMGRDYEKATSEEEQKLIGEQIETAYRNQFDAIQEKRRRHSQLHDELTKKKPIVSEYVKHRTDARS